MNRFVAFGFVLLGLTVLSVPSPAAEVSDPRSLEIQIVYKTLWINGQKVRLPGTRDRLIELLGEPDRETKLANTLLTWDNLGVVGYENAAGEIIAFSVALDAKPYKFWPKKSFSGVLAVDSAEITAGGDISEINRAKQGKEFAHDRVLADSYTVEFKDLLLSLVAADSQTKSSKANFAYLQISVKEK